MSTTMDREIYTTKPAKRKRFLEYEAEHHPLLYIFLLFLVCPFLIVGAVALFTAAVMFPVSLLMGWL